MLVKAAPGVQVPKEGKPREYITDVEDVPQSAYYLRRVTDGDLLEVAADTPAPVAKPKKGAV